MLSRFQPLIATIARLKKENKKVEEKLEQTLEKQRLWWEVEGQPNFSTDEAKLDESQLVGSKQALLYTAIVPAALAAGFLLLILYFAATGGYTQVHLDSHAPRDPRDKYGAPAESWGR